jgi:intracellular multiplication protein IcmC
MINCWRKNFVTLLIGNGLIFYAAVVYAAAPMGKFVDLPKIMTALIDNLHAVIQLVVASAYVVGIWFITSAINELRIYGQARTMTPLQINFTGPLSRFLAGIALLFLPGIIDVSIYSLWNYGASQASILRFDTTGTAEWDKVFDGIRLIVQAFGYISIIRGFILISRAGSQRAQPGAFGKGVMHIAGGILAVNIIATIKVIEYSLGFTT